MDELDIVIRLGMAALIGGIIGIERELHGKAAGLRTHCLVSIGSALFVLVSIEIFHTYQSVATVDPSRVAAQVVTGIGFLGAGTIIRSQAGGVQGLTTAAGLWTVSGIGMACGLGFYTAALIATVITLVVLVIFSWVGRRLGGRDV